MKRNAYKVTIGGSDPQIVEGEIYIPRDAAREVYDAPLSATSTRQGDDWLWNVHWQDRPTIIVEPLGLAEDEIVSRIAASWRRTMYWVETGRKGTYPPSPPQVTKQFMRTAKQSARSYVEAVGIDGLRDRDDLDDIGHDLALYQAGHALDRRDFGDLDIEPQKVRPFTCNPVNEMVDVEERYM